MYIWNWQLNPPLMEGDRLQEEGEVQLSEELCTPIFTGCEEGKRIGKYLSLKTIMSSKYVPTALCVSVQAQNYKRG